MKNVHAKSGAQEESLASPGFVGEGQNPGRMQGIGFWHAPASASCDRAGLN